MTIESFLSYLQRTANTGRETEIPPAEKLAGYHSVYVDVMRRLLLQLSWAGYLETDEFDKQQYIIRGYTVMPTIDALDDLPKEPPKPMIPKSNATIVYQRHAPEELRLSSTDASTTPVNKEEFKRIKRGLNYTAESAWGHNKRGTSKSQKRK